METILEKIITRRRETIERDKGIISPQEMESKAHAMPFPKFDFFESLSTPSENGIHVIAEVKKASPSKGIIAENFNPLDIAQKYKNAGASALSVLTEEDHFMGSDKYLEEISEKVPLPTLRKDFIIDPYQIHQAKCLGASAYLLIVDCLDVIHLKELMQAGSEIGLTALVEVHRESEIDIALECGSHLIGINNRNLRTFETSLEVTLDLMDLVPPDVTLVSESGIHTPQHIEQLVEADIDAVLVGEGLMKNTDTIEQSLKDLLNF